MSDEPKCPGCGAKVNVDQGSILLMGRRAVKCEGCGAELVATASLHFT